MKERIDEQVPVKYFKPRDRRSYGAGMTSRDLFRRKEHQLIIGPGQPFAGRQHGKPLAFKRRVEQAFSGAEGEQFFFHRIIPAYIVAGDKPDMTGAVYTD